MKMKFLLALFALGLGVCVANAQEPTKAIAVLHPTAGNNVTGSVTFTQSGEAVKVVADITGLTPGKHGFHDDRDIGDDVSKLARKGGHCVLYFLLEVDLTGLLIDVYGHGFERSGRRRRA